MRHNYHLISLFLTLFFAIPVSANRDWVKMKALAENSVVTVVRTNKPSNYNMQYFDQTTQQWIDFNVNHTVDLVINLPAVGDSVMFRGQNPEGLGRVEDSNYKYIRFKPTKGEVAVSGDIMTLIDTTETMVNVVPGDGCFLRLFNDATCLYEAKDLRLPATMTSKASYQDMFRACKNLRSAPDMTALEYIEEGACQRMFMGCSTLVQTANMSGLVVVGDNGCSAMYSGCTALTFAHDLVAKYVDQRSYMSMFSSCTSLLAAPRIDAYEMRYETCKQMFYKCSALKSSPDLNAQLLDNGCYESMFEECSSLVHAPALKSTELAYTYGKTSTVYESCYKWMFKNCGKLETIEVYFSKWRGNSSHTYEPTGAWAMGVPKKNTCVFSAPCGLYEEYGQSRIPEFWQFNCFHFFLFDVYSTGAVWDDDRSDYANRALKESDLAQMPRAHKDNNIFLGWNTQPDGTGEMFNIEAMPDTTTVYYAVFQSLVPEEEEVGCINYTKLDDPSVRCDTSALNVGEYKWRNWVNNRLVDYGPRNRQSRHTVHHHPAEVDLRTSGRLHTGLPNGKPAVRLGNWNKKGRERITYTYDVPADGAKILMLYYAAVLENPVSHKTDEQPRFTLELFEPGQEDEQIETCFQFDYISGDISTDPSWHTERGSLCWKDWTMSGVNLDAYQGKTIQIRLTTYDCKKGGHYGYAYFGLECSNGEMKTIQCGGLQEFKAPDGFNYQWYRSDVIKTDLEDAEVLSTEQIFSIPMGDHATYYCNVINKEHPECVFTLKAVADPRQAVAEFDTLPRIVTDGKSIIYVTNNSHTDQNEAEKVDSCAWTVTDEHGNILFTSDEYTPKFEFDQNGTYTLSLVAYLKGKDVECPSQPKQVQVVVGQSGHLTQIAVDTTLCQDDALTSWDGHTRYIKVDDNTYRDTIFSGTSPVDTTVYTLHITRQYPVTQETKDVVFKGQTYTWRNREYRITTLDPVRDNDTDYYSRTGCDSVYYTLELTVTEHEMQITEDATCDNEPYTWQGHEAKYSNLTVGNNYFDTIVSVAGDSTFYLLKLTVNPTYHVTDRVECSASDFPFSWNNYTIQSAADNGKEYRTSSVNGCDSIVTLALSVECKKLNATLRLDTVCANAKEVVATLSVTAGKAESYSVLFRESDPQGHFQNIENVPLSGEETEQLTIPFVQNSDPKEYIRPDDYALTIAVQDTCGNTQTFDVALHVLYPSWIITQRWHDVLALNNDRYNGGYTFSSIRWYHEGTRIPARGAHDSYIYVGANGGTLDFGTRYWAELVRTGEAKAICTCPVLPTRDPETRTAFRPLEVAARRGVVAVKSDVAGNYRLYDICGQLVETGLMDAGQWAEVANDVTAGTYLLLFTSETGETETVKIMK